MSDPATLPALAAPARDDPTEPATYDGVRVEISWTPTDSPDRTLLSVQVTMLACGDPADPAGPGEPTARLEQALAETRRRLEQVLVTRNWSRLLP